MLDISYCLAPIATTMLRQPSSILRKTRSSLGFDHNYLRLTCSSYLALLARYQPHCYSGAARHQPTIIMLKQLPWISKKTRSTNDERVAMAAGYAPIVFNFPTLTPMPPSAISASAKTTANANSIDPRPHDRRTTLACI